MLNKLKKQNNEGFTIIEVMIVLAIAGLILLIVLLAVPALQRNSRNTAIKNDASAVASAINEYKSNNEGSAPTVTDGKSYATDGKVIIGDTGAGATTTNAEAKVQPDTGVVGKSGNGPNVLVDAGSLWIYKGARCDGSQSARTLTVWYQIETSGTATAAKNNKCVEA